MLFRQDERIPAVFPGKMQDGFVECDEYQPVMDGQTEQEGNGDLIVTEYPLKERSA